MTEFVLCFRSAGDAIAGERKLLDVGLDVRMIDSPKTIQNNCGICLRVHSADIGKVKLILGKTIQAIYQENGETFTALP